MAARMQLTSPENGFWFLFHHPLQREQKRDGKDPSISEFPQDS